MSELYQVGGAVCEKPELCECGKPAMNFEERTSATPTNNQIVGRCENCQALCDARREWAIRNPYLEDGRFHLIIECDLIGDFSALDQFDKKHGYPQ